MGSLRSLRNDREQMESSTDAFGYKFDGENIPDNAWYHVDHTGREYCVNDGVRGVLNDLKADYDDDFNVIELHDHLIIVCPDNFSEIQVTVSRPGSDRTKVDRYFTFRPDSDEPSQPAYDIAEEMSFAAEELWDEIFDKEEEVKD